MKLKIVLILISLMLICTCTRDDLNNPEYFSFGIAYGFCAGDCATFFQIRDEQIYRDDMSTYNGSNMRFQSEPSGNENYDLARKLVEDLPAYLTKNPDMTFGCPDCADQGGIHIEIKEDGQILKWHFDTDMSQIPAAIQDYVREVKSVIESLKK